LKTCEADREAGSQCGPCERAFLQKKRGDRDRQDARATGLLIIPCRASCHGRRRHKAGSSSAEHGGASHVSLKDRVFRIEQTQELP
jgi:hypothetical protein